MNETIIINASICFVAICIVLIIFRISKFQNWKLNYGKWNISKGGSQEFNFYKLMSLVRDSVKIEVRGIYETQLDYAEINGREILEIMLFEYANTLKEKLGKKTVKDMKQYKDYENLSYRIWDLNLTAITRILKREHFGKMSVQEYDDFRENIIPKMINDVVILLDDYYTGTIITRDELSKINKEKIFKKIFETFKNIFDEARAIDISYNERLQLIECDIKAMIGGEKI